MEHAHDYWFRCNTVLRSDTLVSSITVYCRQCKLHRILPLEFIPYDLVYEIGRVFDHLFYKGELKWPN